MPSHCRSIVQLHQLNLAAGTVGSCCGWVILSWPTTAEAATGPVQIGITSPVDSRELAIRVGEYIQSCVLVPFPFVAFVMRLESVGPCAPWQRL